ncbi:MAG: hypothetical protein AAGA60_27205 [Cyanobacteria bacterium P01_E01_bin.42]
MQPFIGLNQYQIGLPPKGYGYLFINLSALKNISADDTIAKVESMGYEPKVRYWQTESGLKTCILLKVTKIRNLDEENDLGEEWECLAEIFGNAVRCPIGKAIAQTITIQESISPVVSA